MWSLSPPEPCMPVSLPHTTHMPHPSHSPSSEDPNNIWWITQTMKLLIMQFSPASGHFLRIFKIPQTLFYSLIVRNENAHPYKTTGKTRRPHILTLMSHGEQKYKLIWTEWQQAALRFNPPWNSTRMQYSCFSVSPNVWILTCYQKICWLNLFCDSACHMWTCTQFVLHSVLLTNTQFFQQVLLEQVDQ